MCEVTVVVMQKKDGSKFWEGSEGQEERVGHRKREWGENGKMKLRSKICKHNSDEYDIEKKWERGNKRKWERRKIEIWSQILMSWSSAFSCCFIFNYRLLKCYELMYE